MGPSLEVFEASENELIYEKLNSLFFTIEMVIMTVNKDLSPRPKTEIRTKNRDEKLPVDFICLYNFSQNIKTEIWTNRGERVVQGVCRSIQSKWYNS